MTDISTLIERVRKATGPDRELDFWIETLVVDPLKGDESYTLQDLIIDFNLLGPEGITIGGEYTGSVDAALGVAEHVLPGWRYDLHSPRMGQIFEAVLMDGDGATRRIIVGHAATLPLAIVLATLLAIQSKGAS